MEEKLEAIIEHEGDEKYIVAKLAGEDRTVLVSLPKGYHSDIMRDYAKRIGKSLLVLGGGLLKIDKEKKRIETYGQSGSYGKPEVGLVRKILEKAFPDYSIEARVTEYIRG